jgi:hypothetical protein
MDDGMRPYDFETTITHDAAGRLIEIVETDTRGFRTVAFRAKPPSRRSVVDALAPLLASAISAAVAADHPPEPVYALLLHYDESQPIPPVIVWAFERYRAGVLAIPGANRQGLWNPAVFDHYNGPDIGGVRLHERHPEIGVLAADLEHLDPTGQAARKALQLACRQLNASVWDAVATTDDFVVTCVDLHLEHFAEDLKASVSDPALRRQILAPDLRQRS